MDIFNEFCIEIIKKANKNQAHYYSDITGDFFFKVIFFCRKYDGYRRILNFCKHFTVTNLFHVLKKVRDSKKFATIEDLTSITILSENSEVYFYPEAP